VSRFQANADKAGFRNVIKLLTDVCGAPKRWRPEQDHGIEADEVYRFTLRPVSRLADHFGKGSAKLSEEELLKRLFAEVRRSGCQLVLGDMWEPRRAAKLVLFPTRDPFAVVTAVGTEGVNYGIHTPDIVAWLRDVARRNPFDLTLCRHDSVAGEFSRPLQGAAKLAAQMAEFCPECLGEDCETPSVLANALKESGGFMLWWD
jgi:hypothetical protein